MISLLLQFSITHFYAKIKEIFIQVIYNDKKGFIIENGYLPKYIVTSWRNFHRAIPYIQMTSTILILRQIRIDSVGHVKF